MAKKNKIKFGSIVPLIGGMTVANSKIVGHDPAFFLSYPPFAGNDSHATNYFKKTPYIVIEGEENVLPEDQKALFEDVDFVSAVCPCAGLSMLNSNNGSSEKARGSDAAQNEWMYKSAELVLEHVKPKVFWGENAPGLYTSMGAGVVERLKEIGKRNGYSLSLIKTDTFVHGIPQHRHRSFYFFWKDSEAPILGYHKREAPLLKDYLEEIPEGCTLMDKGFGLGALEDNQWIQFLKHKNYDIKDAIASPAMTVLQLIWREGWINDAIIWGKENEKRDVWRLCERAEAKAKDGKGVWDASPLLFNEATNAIIAKNSGIVHPNGERGITVREAMHLMGLPHDFDLQGGHWNHICQNVPVKTASDWTTEVIRFIKGEITEFGGDFVKQNNVTQKVDYAENKMRSKVLF
jgi:site-specific DNA-cytosine methylase